MGLGIGQLGELTGIRRKHDISRQLQRLSNDKLALSREMRVISMDYNRAMCAKKLQWSPNAGISCTDITYSTLMRPNEYNSKSPILITNSDGRIVIDEKYKKYAEMISPNGAAGGVYSGDTRLKILEELAGISVNDVQSYSSTSDEVQKAADAVNAALEERDKIEIKSQKLDLDKFINQFLNASSLGLSGKTVDKNNAGSIVSTLNGALIGKDYFSEEQEKKIKEKTNEIINGFDTEYSIDDFISFYASIIKAVISGNGAEKIHIMADSNGNGLQSAYDAADKKYKEALETYQKAIDSNAQVYTSEQQIKIDYYDALFTAIVDNGWVYDSEVDDPEYLSQMFQNNQYYITTISKNDCYDPDLDDCLRNYDYTYSTDSALNYDNIYQVNDTDAREMALVEYQEKKRVIEEKEAKIDVKMENLKTERESITKMLETMQKITEDDIEKHFKLFA